MWPCQTHHQYYRVGGEPESFEHHQPQHSEQPVTGSLATSSMIPQSADTSISPGQNRELESHSSHLHQQRQQQRHANSQQLQQMQQHQCRDQTMASTASSNPRASRNMAEKQRRDNLNTNISNMAALVPAVAGSPRRLDKISILRLAATYLRTKYALGSGNGSFLPRRFNKVDLEKFLFETFIRSDGFMIVLTSTGKIVYVGQQVEQCLGHAQADLLGQSLYNYVYPDDHEHLSKSLTPNDSANRLTLTERSTSDENSNSSEDSRSSGSSGSLFNEERRNFDIRMTQRAASRREHAQYACLHVSGLLRPAEACKKLSSGGERTKAHHELNGNDIIFVGIARLMKRRITELSLLDASKEEYVTRHLVDGRIIFCDHRISLVAGYMTNEVSGTSAFGYMHQDDAIYTIAALRRMYSRGEGFGSSCYRLKTKTGKFIYLQTHAYIEIDHERRSFQSFICVNSSVSEEEGEKLSRAMKMRLSATMTSPDSTPEIAMVDSSQLEDAVRHLLSDIESPSASDDYSSSTSAPDEQSMKAICVSQHLPPPSIHASEIGIKCIDRRLPSSGKDKCIKRENDVASPASTHSQQLDDSKDFEESENHGRSNTSTVNVRRGDKIIPDTVISRDEKIHFHSQAAKSNVRYAKRDEDYCKTETSPSCSSSMTSEDCPAHETSQRGELVDSPLRQTTCPVMTTTSTQSCHRGKPESMFQHVKMEKIDYGHADVIERSKNCANNKRSSVDDSTYSNKKKRRANKNFGKAAVNVVENNDSSSGRYDRSSLQSVQFVNNYKEERIVDEQANRCKIENHRVLGNGNSPQYENDSSCNLNDLTIDCSSLNPANVELTLYGDDFPDLRNDELLSPGLHDNPDFMKIFDDSGTMIGYEKNFDDRTISEFPNNDQAVSEGLTRTHIELENRMTMQRNQLSVLEQQLEMPTLHSQFYKPRDTLLELLAENTKNTRMLQTIQQDHRNNMQTNSMKQNIGV